MAAGDEGHLVCGQSAFRAIAAVNAVGFSLSKGGNATDAGKRRNTIGGLARIRSSGSIGKSGMAS